MMLYISRCSAKKLPKNLTGSQRSGTREPHVSDREQRSVSYHTAHGLVMQKKLYSSIVNGLCIVLDLACLDGSVGRVPAYMSCYTALGDS